METIPDMTYALIAVAAVVFLITVYAVVVRGSLGLLRKRLVEDPELAETVPEEELRDGVPPTDIEY